jgi:hypothetical protein
MTPLDEGSARRRDLYLTTRNTHNRQTSIPPAGFEPAIPESERPQTHALDRAATGIGYNTVNKHKDSAQIYCNENKMMMTVYVPAKQGQQAAKGLERTYRTLARISYDILFDLELIHRTKRNCSGLCQLSPQSPLANARRRKATPRRPSACIVQHNPRLKWPANWTRLLELSQSIPAKSRMTFIPSTSTLGTDGRIVPRLRHSTIRRSF